MKNYYLEKVKSIAKNIELYWNNNCYHLEYVESDEKIQLRLGKIMLFPLFNKKESFDQEFEKLKF